MGEEGGRGGGGGWGETNRGRGGGGKGGLYSSSIYIKTNNIIKKN